MSVERSLRRLRTDYLDLVMIHSDGNDLDILLNSGALQTLQQLKQEGWIRALGISSKTVEGGLLAAELCDAVMLMYHADYTEEEPVIAKSALQGAAVLLKKVLGSGHICHDATPVRAETQDSAGHQDQEQDPIQSALNFAYAHSGVTSAVIGTVNLQHLRANLIKALRAQNMA
jgi:aryl-alcohol dehydrogenase-like predicted oxidoreductase